MALKPRIQDVLETVQLAISNAVNAAGITEKSQTIVGIPVITELVQTMRKKNQAYQISVYERPGTSRDEACFSPDPFPYGNVNVPLIATVSISGGEWTCTFSGSSAAGINIHTFVGAPAQDALVQLAGTELLATIATEVANAINALGISGLTATPSGNGYTLTESPILICNVGGSGTVLAQEVGRVCESIQATIWVPSSSQTAQEAASQTAPLRWRVAEAIRSTIGTTDFPGNPGQYLALSDGSGLKISYQTQAIDDASQVQYSLYLYHIVFQVEYGLIRVIEGTQVEALEITETINNNSPVTTVSGG